MSLRSRARLAGALAIFLAGCTSGTVTPFPTATSTAPPIVPSTPSPSTPTPAPLVFTLWLPPAFAPGDSTAAGSLLAARLAEFETAHAGLRLEVRLRDASGPAGLLETLRLSGAVAPAAQPDLIALDSGSLAAAAAEGLVRPYVGDLPEPEQARWYGFALESTAVGGVRYGIPAASQAWVLAYNRDLFSRPPAFWSDVVGSSGPFLFPAADPRSVFVLAQYLSLGGVLEQPDGSAAIDPATLEEVLTFIGSAYNAGILPLTTRQYDRSTQTWTALLEGHAASAMAPLSAWMGQGSEALPARALPTRSGMGTTLADTWSWALVTTDDERQAIAVELIEWLSRPDFLGPWTRALGWLPPNEVGLEAWRQDRASTLVRQLVVVALPLPPTSILDVVGPALRSAVDSVLSGAQTPQNAALEASTAVGAP
jgi:ABC-type glycerol-3-phosphate transport system substrate-binding protein